MTNDPHTANQRANDQQRGAYPDAAAGTVEDRIGTVAKDADLIAEQARMFRTVSESMAVDGWELTDAGLRAGAQLAAGRADHLRVRERLDEVIDDAAPADEPRQIRPADSAGADDDVIACARAAVGVTTGHGQLVQHRENERARDEELRRWLTNDHASDRQVGTELPGRGPSAGAAW